VKRLAIGKKRNGGERKHHKNPNGDIFDEDEDEDHAAAAEDSKTLQKSLKHRLAKKKCTKEDRENK